MVDIFFVHHSQNFLHPSTKAKAKVLPLARVLLSSHYTVPGSYSTCHGTPTGAPIVQYNTTDTVVQPQAIVMVLVAVMTMQHVAANG